MLKTVKSSKDLTNKQTPQRLCLHIRNVVIHLMLRMMETTENLLVKGSRLTGNKLEAIILVEVTVWFSNTRVVLLLLVIQNAMVAV